MIEYEKKTKNRVQLPSLMANNKATDILYAQNL